MKKINQLLLILLGVVLFSGVGIVSAVECSVNIEESCTVSTTLTFNRTATFLFNDTGANGAIIINGTNAILDCNSSTISGNWTSGSSINYRGFQINANNVTVKNCGVNGYRFNVLSNNNFTIIDNITIGFGDRGVQFTGSNLYNSTIVNNRINNITTAGFLGNSNMFSFNISNNIFTNMSTRGYLINPNLNTTSMIFSFNNFTEYRGAIFTNQFRGDYGSQVFNNYCEAKNQTTGINRGCFQFSGSNSSNFYNNTIKYSGQGVQLSANTWNMSIHDNIIRENDKGINIKEADNFHLFNNTYINNTLDWDSYDIDLQIKNSTNGIIEQENFSGYSSAGLVIMKSNNMTVRKNYFDAIPMSQRSSYLAGDYQEPPCAISVIELYKTYLGDGEESGSSLSNITFIGTYVNSNVSLSGNTFGSSVACLLRTEGSGIIANDLTNYWYRRFAFPTDLKDTMEFWISNNFNNISQYINSGASQGVNNNLTSSYRNAAKDNSNLRPKGNYHLFKDYLLLDNINTSTSYNAAIYNLSNVLIYFSNNSVACSNINSCDGNINITLSPNNYSYVLDNYNLTEGISRQNSPLWFAQATLNEVHIASNISAINTTVKINNLGWGENCRFVTELSYTPNGSTTQLWQDDIQAQSICTQLTTTGYVLQVNPSVNSNVLRITYTTQSQGAGGGGSIGGDPLGNTDLNLCNLTYKYIKNYSQTDYSQIDASKGNYSWTEVRRYLDNWQPYCSNAIKRTLKEEYVCDKLFYFIVENQGSYSLSDINSLRNELTPEIQISNNLLMYYTDNYETMCKYGKTLPFKRDKIGNLTIIKNLTDCNLNTNLSLFGLDYDKINIPLGKIYISETSCKTLNFYKWFINIEREEDNLIINGIKFGWLITLFLIISIILIIKNQSKTNSMMRGMFKKS